MANVLTKKRLTSDEKKDKEILTKALERYEDCQISCNEVYKTAIDDIKFSIGEQWSSSSTKDRQDRPCLVENRLAGMIHQVVNDQRQNRSMMTVTPVDSIADPETAEIINGLLRHIQYASDSETAVDTAFDCAVRGGIGYYRIITDYEDDETFNQEVLINRVDNIEAVRFPIHLCKEIDFRDAPYAFVEETISKEEFEDKYPDADIENWQSTSNTDGWITDKDVRIAEYFVVDKDYYDVYLLSDNSLSKDKPAPESGLTVVDSRKTCKRSVKWYKITATQILERADFPGKWIPIIPVLGEEVNINGKRNFISLTRNAKDPQRMLNYWRSAEAERIALAPKAPWIAAANQIENYEAEWVDSNRSNVPVLHYEPMIEGGVLVPPPQRAQPTQMDMAIVNAARESIDAIKACTGIFDASLGQKSNESSGRAIVARQREGDTGNFHFHDNSAKSMRHACRVIVDMIPEIYDTERAIRILGEDQKEKVVQVNQQYSADGKIYDLTAGKYDVIVETGPSFMSKRQETAANLRDLSQNDPVLIQSTRDLIMKYLDMPSEVVERAQKTIDPKLLHDDKKINPAELQAQLAQGQQTIQQLDQVIQKMDEELAQYKTQAAIKSEDNKTKLAIAELQAQVQLLINSAKITQQNQQLAHEVGMEAMSNYHSIQQSDIEAQRAAMMQQMQPQQPGANPESQQQ